MSEAGSRRLNKSFFQIVALLFLVHIGQSLVFGNYRLRNQFVKGWKETKAWVTQLTEAQSGTEFILTLLDEAYPLATRKHLETFYQYLQAAVDEAHRQKVEKSSDVTLKMQQLRKILDDPEQQEKSKANHPLVRKLKKAREERLEVYRMYLELKEDAFNGKTEETETKLRYTFNKIKSWKKIYNFFENLPIMFVCALALYWTCSCICCCIF